VFYDIFEKYNARNPYNAFVSFIINNMCLWNRYYLYIVVYIIISTYIITTCIESRDMRVYNWIFTINEINFAWNTNCYVIRITMRVANVWWYLRLCTYLPTTCVWYNEPTLGTLAAACTYILIQREIGISGTYIYHNVTVGRYMI